MPPAELHSLYLFYTCPRPVVLVSVVHGERSNLFPMDLIGPSDSPYFLMALRQTSPAVQLMQHSRQLALSSIPAAWKLLAYDLGKHHKASQIDLNTLPFPTLASPTFGLPVPQSALRVREVTVQQSQAIGSHILFVTQVVQETHWRDGTQMFHIPGLYQQYLHSQQRPLSTY